MKSIRLSLLLYFLGLLIVALGTASVFAYQTAHTALEARRAATAVQIENTYLDRRRTEERRFDEALRSQAITMSKLVQLRPNYKHLNCLGVLGTPLAPQGPFLLTYGWLIQAPWNSPGWRPLHIPLFDTILGEAEVEPEHAVPGNVGTPPADYYQIDTMGADPLRSPSLGGDRLPVDLFALNNEQKPALDHEDVTLQSGRRVRMVLIRARVTNPLTSMNTSPPSRPHFPPRGGGRESPPPLSSPKGNPWGGPRWSMFIHCAYDLDRLDEAFGNLRQRRDEELREDAEKTETDLASLRNRLLLISTLTFLAAIGGTFGLIRAGLSPLRRLSEAVSRVSPRDFRLPFPERRLPAELKPIVGRLRETLALLKRTFAREKQATADISHELRTPLAVLLTTTELGLRKPRSAEQYRELLTDCRSSAQQMNEVVQRLLTLARLDAGVDLLNNRAVDVTQLAEQCATMVRPLAEAQGLVLQLQPSPTLVVNTDPDKMREVLNNLLHNAIQYNRPNGRIDIRVAQDTNRVRLEVSDTGIGIAADAREQIFERFYRADPSRGGDGLHAGLGLALVKEYVGLMGGRIAVNSIEGQGSTFQVWLPA